MTPSRPSVRVALGTSLALVVSLSIPAAAEEEEGSLGSDPSNVIGLLDAQPADLLGPAAQVLSGQAWLRSEGIDPGQGGMPAYDPWTGTDFGAASPRTQAAGAGAPVPFREPGPAFSRNILVTRDFGTSPFQTEPHIEANPDDPEHLVLGVIDYAFPSMSTYVSFDGGERWEGPNQVPYLLQDFGAGGDPIVTFDSESNVYLAYISIGVDEFNLGPIEVAAQVSSIAVAKSEDDGFTWPVQISAARSGVNTDGLETDRFGRLRGTVDISFLDKPWMASGPHPDDPETDVIYVTYTNFDISYDILYIGEIPNLLPTEMRTGIELVKSEDGGRTWTDPVAVSPVVRRAYGETGDGSGATGVFGTLRVVQGSQPEVAVDGTVHVAWMDSTDDDSQEGVGEIQVASSTDAGETWSTPVVAAVFNEVEFRPRTNFFRFWASSFPQIAAGPEGEIHIAYVGRPSDKPDDDGDVFLTTSTDGGLTWSRPKVLNDDDTEHVQIFPSIDVDPNGVVHAMWGDFRDSPHQTRYHIYYTRSEDGGQTFGFTNEELALSVGDTRVTDFPSNPNYAFPRGLFIGDYFSLTATEDDVHMAWADARLGEFGPINQKIAVARTEAVDSPEIFISPPSGPGGQEVTLQGFSFQPDLGVFVQLGDSTISTLRTNLDGEFTARIYMPITSEGSQTISVFDESGNGASTSYFTDFGFGNIQDALQDLGERIEGLESGSQSDEE
ncbi:MAG: sialidase family protein [Chloroflexota bacterium]|jgi:hypothetical protein